MAAPSNRERFPELYNQAHVDRRTCTRVVPMRVLVLGMMRTGTMCKCLLPPFKYILAAPFRKTQSTAHPTPTPAVPTGL